MNNLVTFMCLRVFNPTRASLLIRRFRRTQVWSLPIIELDPPDDDPMNHMDEMIEELKVRPNFELIAALPIIRLEEEDKIWDEGVRDYRPKIFRTVIYELQYEGFVCPGVPPGQVDRYDMYRWVTPGALRTMTKINRSTSALGKMMEKETCLS